MSKESGKIRSKINRENQKSTIFVPVADLSDVNNKEVRYEKFGCDIGLAIRDDRIYLLASHL